MEQKITWMHYLIFGISAIALVGVSSCDKGETEPIQQGEYVYVNKLAGSLRLELYDSEAKSSFEFVVKSNDSITFIVKGDPGAFPFAENEISNRTGDSIILRFEGNKCTSYTRNTDFGTFGGDGVFNLEDYENYSLPLVNEKKYRLVYFIAEKDFNRALNCE